MIYIYLAVLFLISGCSDGPWLTKVRSVGDSNGDDKVVLTGAKERAISYMSVGYYEPGDKLEQGRIKPKRIVCAEPSPDVASAVSDSIKTSLEARASKPGFGEASLDAEYSRAFSESLAQLGTRLATIQLLRDELSDLCRAYANGAVSSITYTLRLSRLDKKMITLLIGEASAGALSRALVSASGSASAGRGVASKEQIQKADQRVKDAVEAVSAANKDLKTKVEDRNKQTDPEKIKEADAKVATAEEVVRIKLAELSDRMLERWALDTQGSGLLSGSTAGAIAALPTTAQRSSSVDLGSIHRTYLDNDDLGTLIDACLTSLEENEVRTSSTDLDKLYSQIENKQKEIHAIVSEQRQAEAKIEQWQRLNPTRSLPLDSQDIKTREASEVKRLTTMTELEFLERKAEALKGGSSSGLATFCRSRGMERIVEMMSLKITEKIASDRFETMASLCKTAVEKKADSIIAHCANYDFRPTSRRMQGFLP